MLTIKAGTAFWIERIKAIPRHPGFVLAVVEQPGVAGIQCVLITITSAKPGREDDPRNDPDGLLLEGDHDIITRNCHAVFARPVIKFEKQVIEMIQANELEIQDEPFSDELLTRMRDGALKSKFSPPILKELVNLGG